MTEFNEAVFVPPPEEPDEKSEDTKEPVTIRCALFFDGTLNNRTNVNARKTNSEAYQATKSLWHRTTGWGSDKGDGSYENEESNIARMEPNIMDSDGFDLTLKVYTEGAGTFDEEGDSKQGAGTGKGPSGVISKVEKGILDAVNQIREARDPDQFVIKQLIFDLFGFSRGAAGARYCIHCLLMDERQPIKRRLEALGFEVEQVAVQFVGLYDTVSSYGLPSSFKNNTATLKLDAIRHAEKVIQLAAADEHRKNFSLTTIESAGHKGEQYYLPGAHSDIGGGYVDGAFENQTVFIGFRPDAIADRKKWVEDGWYRDDEISDVSSVMGPSRPIQETLTVHRKSVSNAYSLIPLKIMAKFSQENGISINPDLDDAASVTESFPDLQELEQKIYRHIGEGSANSRAECWHGVTPLLRRVRNAHLHVSAQYTFGMKPRFKQGKRYRKEYDG